MNVNSASTPGNASTDTYQSPSRLSVTAAKREAVHQREAKREAADQRASRRLERLQLEGKKETRSRGPGHTSFRGAAVTRVVIPRGRAEWQREDTAIHVLHGSEERIICRPGQRDAHVSVRDRRDGVK